MTAKKSTSKTEKTSENNAQADNQGPQFNIEAIFLKDCSFESPNPFYHYTGKWDPDAKVDLRTEATSLNDDQFEVVVEATITVEVDGKAAFVAEAKQGGCFRVSNIPDDQKHRLMHSFCPNILFPYLRHTISDLISRGGFPPLYLNPVDFEGQYQRRMEQEDEAQ